MIGPGYSPVRTRPRWCPVLLAICGVVAAAGAAGAAGNDAWVEVPTETFVLVANVHAQRAAEMAQDLETFRLVLERELPALRPPQRPVTIYAFDSRRSMRKFYGGGPRALGGVFVRGPVGETILVDAGTRIRQQHAYHEYVHYRLRTSFAALPAWLAEGLAYYYQTFERTDDGYAAGAPVPGLGLGLNKKAGLAVAELLDPELPPDRYTKDFARQSWRLVHYLHSLEANPIADLLSVGAGRSLDDVLGQTPAEISVAVARYAGEGGLRPRRLEAVPTSTDAMTAPRVLATDERLVRLGELSETVDAGTDRGAGRSFFERALRESPSNPRALLGLARRQIAAGELEAAATNIEKALVTAPDHPSAHLAHGQLAMARFAHWRSRQPDGVVQTLHADVTTARESFERAMALSPGLPEAVRGYARTYLFDPVTRQPGIDACRAALAKRNDLDIALALVELLSDDANRQAAHEARAKYLLPLRGPLSTHGDGIWAQVATKLARHDMLLAERLWEQGRTADALAVLVEAAGWAPAPVRADVDSLHDDIEARPAVAGPPAP